MDRKTKVSSGYVMTINWYHTKEIRGRRTFCFILEQALRREFLDIESILINFMLVSKVLTWLSSHFTF